MGSNVVIVPDGSLAFESPISNAYERWIRPNGIVVGGHLQLGLEALIVPTKRRGRIVYWKILEVRPHTGIPNPYLVAPAFVNAHSHLEYRGMLDKISHPNYFEWIWELTRMKREELSVDVQQACQLAAEENFRSGVAWIGEHSDRVGAAEELAKIGIGGWVFQEMLDAFDENPDERHKLVHEKLEMNRQWFPSISVSAHAAHTVLESTLSELALHDLPLSIHVNETVLENEFFVHGSGQIAESRRQLGLPVRVNGMRVIPYLDSLGLLGERTQIVHACDLTGEDIQLLAKTQTSVVHCPRSNERLRCPKSPVRELLNAGVNVGLGLDSPASGGVIDMFAEMRAAYALGGERGRPLHADEVWNMANDGGYQSFGRPFGVWNFEVGAEIPLLELHLPGVRTTEDLIEHGTPDCIEWLSV